MVDIDAGMQGQLSNYNALSASVEGIFTLLSCR